MITACMIDSREPDWVQHLDFDGVPTSVETLEYGDLHAVTDDGCLLVIERKTPDDLLNSLRDDRLFIQMAGLAELRITEQLAGNMMTWPYLVITGELGNNHGKVTTPERGVTGWDYNALQGALLDIQQMGVFIISCSGDMDFENCVIRLGKRRREPMKLLPPRPAVVLGPGAALLASLPGIGIERVIELMRWSNNVPAHAITGLTDLAINPPGIPKNVQHKVRSVLGLKAHQDFVTWVNSENDEILQVVEKVGG
jgi:hypothetical protein